MWIGSYQTRLSQKVITEFLESIRRVESHILKLGLVGCSFCARWKINRRKKNWVTFPVKYFIDPEDAKRWLVTENG